MKILIMGGNQFLGKALAERLINENYEVFVLNRGNRENIKEAKHIKADRTEVNQLRKGLKDLIFDVIIDVSAYTRDDVGKLYEVMKGKFKHYILISSASIYNNISQFPASEEADVGENNLWGEYAKNKFLAEVEAKKMLENYTIFRPFYIYGIGNNLDREKYIFSRIENNLTIYLPNKGENIIQFGYIEDLVDAIIYSFGNKEFYRETFNISGDEKITIKDFVKLCSELAKKKVFINYIECNNNLKARDWFPFRDTDLYGNIEKIKVRGFKNKFSLEQGLLKTYKYLKTNDLLKYPIFSEVEIKFNKK